MQDLGNFSCSAMVTCVMLGFAMATAADGWATAAAPEWPSPETWVASAYGPPPPPANASAIKVACVGDSITQGFLSTHGMTYPNQLQTMLGAGYKVMNFGEGGRTMLKKGDNPYWRSPGYPAALKSEADILILMLGTNDAKWRNWGPLAAEFPVDYASMIASFKNMTSKPKIWLMVPPPLYADGVYGMNQTVINTLFPGTGPAGVRTLARTAGLPPPVDLFALFQGLCPVTGGTPGHPVNKTDTPCGYIAGNNGNNACHPNNIGYGKIAAAVKATIA